MTKDKDARRERRLEAAKGAYLARFGEEAPVASYHLDHPRLSDLLMEAAEDGKPLTAEALAEGLGGPHSGRWGRS
jgi:hypothetical protein